MAIYVDSAASGAANGTSWADAYTTLKAAEDANTGDNIIFWLADTHSESTAGDITFTFASGITTLGTQVLSVDATSDPEPPTALKKGAVITTTTASEVGIQGSVYVFGAVWNIANSTGRPRLFIGTTQAEVIQCYEECDFNLVGTGSTGELRAADTNAELFFYKCTIKTSSSVSSIINGSVGRSTWIDCSFDAADQTPNNFLNPGGTWQTIIKGFDLSAADAGIDIVASGGSDVPSVKIDGIKFPSSWSGTNFDSGQFPNDSGNSLEMANWSEGDNNFDFKRVDAYGELTHDDRIYFTGTVGAKRNTSDVPFARKIECTSVCTKVLRFYSNWAYIYSESTSSQTLTIEIIHDESANLKDNEIWLEAMQEGTSGFSLPVLVTDKTDVLVAGADQATSSVDWDDGLTERANSTGYSVGDLIKSSGTAGSAFIVRVGGTSDSSAPAGYTSATDGDSFSDNDMTVAAMRRQKIAITFTSAEQGKVEFRIVCAKASITIWASALETVT